MSKYVLAKPLFHYPTWRGLCLYLSLSLICTTLGFGLELDNGQALLKQTILYAI